MKKMKIIYGLTEYQFKTISELIKNIEEDFYEIFLKLQKITTEPEVHYLSVKYFLIKHKLLMALKSMKILSQNKNSFHYVEGSKLINLYLKNNQDNLKGKEIIINKAKEFIEDNVENIEIKEENKFKKFRYQLYQKNIFNNPKENNKIIFDHINSYTNKELRKLSGEEIYNLLIFSSLYTNEEGIKEIKNLLKEKMKLIDVDEKDIIRNLNFFEDKKFD